MIDVCICTYNPRVEILAKTLASIRNQNVDPSSYRLLIVDNGSTPALSEEIITDFLAIGVAARIVREMSPGIAKARLRAMDETDAEWLLFVDDDNELMPDYLSHGLAFIGRVPKIGCFGGKLLLPSTLSPSSWVKPFLPYLAIKDIGDETLVGQSDAWGQWEPPTAGAFIRRSVLTLYQQKAREDERLFELGRKGKNNLSSCEDSLIMRGAASIGLSSAYYPKLALNHYIDSKRFKFIYLIRLMYAYGQSHVTLESLLNGPQAMPVYYATSKTFYKTLFGAARGGAKQSYAFSVGMVAYHLGARAHHIRQGVV
jgi:glycosyltransferase involved in cell wall biosynthesis